jgi:ribosome-associated translation inhibitor RaiA
VSGLPYEEREFQAEIVREGEKLLSRFEKSFDVQALSVHVKKEGSGFGVRARLDAEKSFNASAFNFRLEVAVAAVMAELGKMAGKEKVSKMTKRNEKGREEEEE